jgi:H+/Cl- antiporter ClcA
VEESSCEGVCTFAGGILHKYLHMISWLIVCCMEGLLLVEMLLYSYIYDNVSTSNRLSVQQIVQLCLVGIV